MNKNISSIQYNSLNLPSSITYQNGNMASYVYSAAGGKLSVSYQTGTGNTSTQYCGNIIYDNNNLSQVLIDGGYITFSGTTPQYHYYLQDHLGSNRVVVNESGTAEQVTHYYPFGGIIADLSSGQDVQPYKYNGKELDRMHGLDWYDYGARNYDAAIGSWPTVDPLCEKYYSMSPYNYCGNNPIRFVDLHGDSIYFDIPVIQNGEVVSSTRYTYGKYGNTYGFGRNGELYQGSNTTITAVSNSLNKISSGGWYGSLLVNSISGNSSKDVLIGVGYNATSYNDGDSYIKVTWDQNNYEGAGIDVTGNKFVEPFITLGHELIHAYNYINGEVDNRPWFTLPNGKTILYEEHNVSVRENLLRAENGIPLRKYYAVYKDSYAGYEPSLIINPRCFNNIISNQIW